MAEPTEPLDMAPVERSREQARQTYDRIARWYDLMAAPFEGPHLRRMLELLEVRPGETALDVGFGTGDVLVELARTVGPQGRVAGIDLSEKMKEVAAQKLDREDLSEEVELCVGDATSLPFEDQSFDVVCSTFTIELFELSEMEAVLGECRRVLRPGGRFGVAAMSTHESTGMSRLYQRARRHFPAALDCRPIPAEKILETNHFDIQRVERSSMAGIPVVIVVARPIQ